MQTRAQILNDESLNSYQRGKLLEQLPPEQPHRPVMTEEIRQRLRSLSGQIAGRRDALAAADAKVPRMESKLEQVTCELRTLGTAADYENDEAVLKFVLETGRKLFLANALRDAPESRRQMLQDLSNLMRQLDSLLNELAMPGEFPRNFFDLQNSPVPRCGQALAFIEMKLRQ